MARVPDTIVTAAFRAGLSAVIVGGLGFLAMWSQTDELKQLLIAGLVPALTTLGLRLGVEGTIDTRKS